MDELGQHEVRRAKCAVVFSCDNAFGPLALGLVYSLKALGYPDDFDIFGFH